MPFHLSRRRAARRCSAFGRAISSTFRCELLEERRLLTNSVSGIPQWLGAGPAPIEQGQVIGMDAQKKPQAGAINAVLTPRGNGADANVIYVGTVNGGVWKTIDALGANGPTWTPLTDEFPSLSITDLAFDPKDATLQTIWAAVGRNSSSLNDGGPLIGLLKTIDGGDHWKMMGFTTLKGQNLFRVLPTSQASGGQVVLAAGDGGLFRSEDGGGTFKAVSDNGTSGLPAGRATDLLISPTNANRFFVAVPGKGVFMNDGNAGKTWTLVSGTLAGLDTVAKASVSMKMATSGNTLYVVTVQGTDPKDNRRGVTSGLFRTDDNGATWRDMGIPLDHEPNAILKFKDEDENFVADASSTIGLKDFGPNPGKQGGVHLSILADPTNPDLVFVGGDRNPTGLDI
jgi:photosystem II stability/assembly factor-like uncharacterized protein